MIFVYLLSLLSTESSDSLVALFIACTIILLASSWFVGKRPFRDMKHYTVKYFDEDGNEYKFNKKGKLKKMKKK